MPRPRLPFPKIVYRFLNQSHEYMTVTPAPSCSRPQAHCDDIVAQYTDLWGKVRACSGCQGTSCRSPLWGGKGDRATPIRL